MLSLAISHQRQSVFRLSDGVRACMHSPAQRDQVLNIREHDISQTACGNFTIFRLRYSWGQR